MRRAPGSGAIGFPSQSGPVTWSARHARRGAGSFNQHKEFSMAQRVDLLVRGGTVVTADDTYPADVAITNGTFTAIGAPGTLEIEAAETLDASGRYLLPGVIDGHVHFREPGSEYKEDFHTGSRAAVMGGVTTVLDMPNTTPTTSSAENVELKRRLAEEKSYVDFGLIGLLVNENVDRLREMAAAG